MNEKGIKSYLTWLGDNLMVRRRSVLSMLDRLRDVCMKAGSHLYLYKKFMKLLEQISGEREKEIYLIDEIQAVEKKHAEMRKQKKLRRARCEKDKDCAISADAEPKPKRTGLWTLLGVMYLLSRSKKEKPDLK